MTAAAPPIIIPARAAGDILALRTDGAVTVAQFLAEVNGLAQRLPATGYALNLCASRYHFLVGFVAALARGITTLLPPNPLAGTVNALAREWPGSFVLSDAPAEDFDAPLLRADGAPLGRPAGIGVAPDMLAAVAFTSGSTGESLPIRKSWHTLAASTAINLRYYLPPLPSPAGGALAVVATVPAQHMYGLEATILPALLGPVAMHTGRPFYPADVLAALRAAPAPRILVSTPVHLRALAACGLEAPPVARVLSATAPLEPALAVALEAQFGAEVVEIYGCSEVGSMASRRTAAGERWRFFDGLRPALREGSTWLAADHLPAPVRLPDTLEFAADGSFVIAGRDSDLVKIGGKRGSLAEVTRLLLAVPGVEDAAVFVAPAADGEGRLAALVVAPGLDAAAVRAGLRPFLDPVFIPRQILLTPALPRAASGKLPREALLALYAELAR